MPICGLCRNDKELKDSHLIPKSLYKALRNAYEGDDLVFTDHDENTSRYTDFQVKSIFLCEDCEEKLNKYGENIVSPECHKGEHKFELLSKVKQSTPVFEIKNEKWINPYKEKKYYPEEYLYFAASVFWRASAWPNDKHSCQNSLGSKYQELFRRYLLGEIGFPENAYLAVYIDNSPEIIPLVSFPTVSNKNGYHHHIFYIPGIKFSLLVGSKELSHIKDISLSQDTKIFFISS